jgi:hypothetical protein
VEIQLRHPLEDASGVLRMSGIVRGEDQEIVHVNYEPSFSNDVTEKVVHESLKRGGGVVHAKEHDRRFEEAFMGEEGALPLISVLDVDVVIAPSNVKFGKDLSSFEFVDEVRDEGKRVGIASGVGVQVSIVLTGAKFTVLFLYKEERGGLGGFGRSDLSATKVFFQESFCGFLFVWGEGIHLSYFRDKGIVEVYGVVIGARGWEARRGFFGED